MYEPFYGLEETPFSLTPDSRFLFLSEQHRAAMAALLYGIQQRKGFVCLTGEVGSGKTTLCRALINRLSAEKIRIGVILNSYLSDIELLRTINDEFGLESHFDSKKDLIDVLNGFLIEENRKGYICAIVIDEAQNLPRQTLEQLRMLGNLESETTKLFQIVLVGQPELNQILSRPDLEQLDSRIAVRFHLAALSTEELLHYIRHRLLVAGSHRHIEFTSDALDRIAAYTRCIPRRVNQVCDRCLLVGYVADSYVIDARMVDQAWEEVSGPGTKLAPSKKSHARGHRWKIAAVLLASLGLVSAALWLALGGPGYPDLLSAMTRTAASDPVANAAPPEPPQTPEVPPIVPKAPNNHDSSRGATNASAVTSNTVTSRPASSKPASQQVDGVLLTAEAPTIAPASMPASMPASAPTSMPASKPASAPASLPAEELSAKDSWTYDLDGVMRVSNAGVAKMAAVMTIARLWDERGNLAEFRKKTPAQVAALDPFAYAASDLKMHVFDGGPDFSSALSWNLPLLVEFSSPQPSHCRYGAVIGLMENQWLVADPKTGIVKWSLKDLVTKVSHYWVLYKDSNNLVNFAPGDEDSRLLKVQQFLEKRGLLASTPTRKFDSRMQDSLRQLQREKGLPQSGLLDESTVLAIVSAMAPSQAQLLKR